MDARKRMLNRLPRNGHWYDIRNADTETATVRIYDEIGLWGVNEEDFARELANVSAGEIEVQISSPGGDVFAGLAIYNALRAHPARVTTRVDGVAASIASVISQAGDHRVILSGAQMMIHSAWGVAIGPAAELREFAELLDKQTANVAAIYASRSGGDVEKFTEMLAAGDTWLSANEAVEMGLADEVVDPKPKGKPKDAAAVTVAMDPEWAEKLAALTAQIEALNKTSPAEREEATEAPEAEVDRDEAERLLALFAPTEGEAS